MLAAAMGDVHAWLMSVHACVHTPPLHVQLPSIPMHITSVLTAGKYQCNGSQGMLAIPLFTMGPALAVLPVP